jgi:hypothetical protein
MSNTLWNPYQLKVPQPLIWKDKKFDYDCSGNIIYIGQSVVHNPSTVTGDFWWIQKITYDESSNVTDIEGPLTGNWYSRASLGWRV